MHPFFFEEENALYSFSYPVVVSLVFGVFEALTVRSFLYLKSGFSYVTDLSLILFCLICLPVLGYSLILNGESPVFLMPALLGCYLIHKTAVIIELYRLDSPFEKLMLYFQTLMSFGISSYYLWQMAHQSYGVSEHFLSKTALVLLIILYIGLIRIVAGEYDKGLQAKKNIDAIESIQNSLVPSIQDFYFDNFEITTHFAPALEAGGDWYATRSGFQLAQL